MNSPLKFGSEFLVNTTTDKDQIRPEITGLSGGRFVVSWTDSSRTGGDTSQFASRAQLFNGDGSKAGDEFLLNTSTFYGQYLASQTALADGGFVAVWTDSGHFDGVRYGGVIRAQFFDADGTKVGGEILVNTTTQWSQFEPTATTLSDGRIAVTWTDASQTGGDKSGTAVRAQILNPDGSKSGGEFLVNSSTMNKQEEPKITALQDGRFVIIWEDANPDATDGTSPWVSGQVFNADGSKAGGELKIPTASPNFLTYPSITTLTDGRFVASWTHFGEFGSDSSGSAVLARIFNADGSAAGGEFLVNTATKSLQTGSSIAALADGRFVVSWSDSSEPEGASIRAQVFGSDGTKAGSEFLVNTTTFSAQTESAVTALADGRFAVTWTDRSGTGGDTWGTSIRAQIFDPREAAVTLDGSRLADDFFGTGFDDRISGKRGGDDLHGQAGKDVLNGNKGHDRLFGEEGRDKLVGGAGNDILKGGKANDLLFGGGGKDKLIGGVGKDKITGGAGQDQQTGGAGADTFIFNNTSESGTTRATRDTIRDFGQSQADRIDLSGIDAKTGAGNQAFTFIAGGDFTSTKGELRYRISADKTIIEGDTDGDGVRDFSIALDGLITLSASDFIL